MSLERVAEAAGVSVATVSRVLNSRPNVSAATAESVRRAMAEIQYKPQRIRRRPTVPPPHKLTLGFLVLGTRATRAMQPAFTEELIRGVSATVRSFGSEMDFAFVITSDDMPQRVLQQKVDGLLLHGVEPNEEIQALIKDIPAVWLMSNRRLPRGSDQVMPDNTGVGEIAADYLIDRGHTQMAFVNMVWRSWFWEIRARAFMQRARERGAEVAIVPAEALDLPPAKRTEPWRAAGVVESLLKLKPRPTGLYIGEDNQVPSIAIALQQQGFTLGRDKDFEIIACNNDKMHFSMLDEPPATIDIQAEAIGRRGVELLIARIENPENEHVRMSIEPMLIAPTTKQPH